MAVIAYVFPLDTTSSLEARVVGLRETPAAGDTIMLKGGIRVRVSRREFQELNGDDKIDVKLGVRVE